MSQGTVLLIMQDAIVTALKTAAPPLLVALVVGVLVSIFQATTQINEQTLAFVPKIACILLTLILFGSWMLSQLQGFFLRVYEYTRLAGLLPPFV